MISIKKLRRLRCGVMLFTTLFFSAAFCAQNSETGAYCSVDIDSKINQWMPSIEPAAAHYVLSYMEGGDSYRLMVLLNDSGCVSRSAIERCYPASNPTGLMESVRYYKECNDFIVRFYRGEGNVLWSMQCLGDDGIEHKHNLCLEGNSLAFKGACCGFQKNLLKNVVQSMQNGREWLFLVNGRIVSVEPSVHLDCIALKVDMPNFKGAKRESRILHVTAYLDGLYQQPSNWIAAQLPTLDDRPPCVECDFKNLAVSVSYPQLRPKMHAIFDNSHFRSTFDIKFLNKYGSILQRSYCWDMGADTLDVFSFG